MHALIYRTGLPKFYISFPRLNPFDAPSSVKGVEITRIAVVGAGIAGITCAKELDRRGHEVEIFEMAPRNSSTRPRQMEGSVGFFGNVPLLKANSRMRVLEINSPNTKVLLEGDVGFFYQIGGENGIEAKARRSIEKSLPVHYSTTVKSRRELQQNFDVMIAADGYRSMLAREAGLRSETPKRVGVAVGFTVKGDFDPESMAIWFGNRFSFHGYAYAIPFSKYEASLVSTSIGKTVDSETYRGRLREIAMSRKWQIQDEWIDFESWYDFSSYCKDNIYVIGNAGSFTEPAYGFGLKWAIESAKLCARAIHKKIDFNHLVEKNLIPQLGSWNVTRKFFESAEDDDYDMFVRSFNRPQVKDLMRENALTIKEHRYHRKERRSKKL